MVPDNGLVKDVELYLRALRLWIVEILISYFSNLILGDMNTQNSNSKKCYFLR